jgi:dihydroorotase
MEKVVVESLCNVHSHERDGEVRAPLIQAAIAGGADVLGSQPNVGDGLITAAQVNKYTQESQTMVPSNTKLKFIPFVMLTESTTERIIDECVDLGIRDAKIYPKDRTTKSQNGVVRYGAMLPVIKHAGKKGLKCHFHFEHPHMNIHNRDAEYLCLPLARIFLEETDAQIVWEHGTDGRLVPYWIDMAEKFGRFAVTLTAHHLAENEDNAFGDVASVCKPPIKTERDRRDLLRLVEADYPWVMAGGDDAFHDIADKHKENGKCNCGAYTYDFLLQLYAHTLPNLMKTSSGVETFVNFTSRNARKFHDLPPSSKDLTLVREPFQIPSRYSVASKTAIPFWGTRKLDWSLVH